MTKPLKLSPRARTVLAALAVKGAYARLYGRIRDSSVWSMASLDLRAIGREIDVLKKAGLVEIRQSERDFRRDSTAHITPAGRAFHEANPVEAAPTWWLAKWGYDESIRPVEVIASTPTRVTLKDGSTAQRLDPGYHGYYPTQTEAAKAFLGRFQSKLNGARHEVNRAEADYRKAERIVGALKS